MKICLSLLLLATVSTAPVMAQPAPPIDAEAAYTRTITERADKIVATLGIADTAQATRVRDSIAGYYRTLRELSDARDAQIKAAKANPDKAAGDAGALAAKNDAQMKLDARHKEFIGQLLGELSPAQADKVKDGLTYGVVPLTYGVYLQMLPSLTDAQKSQIKAWLYEAREYAMDGGTSNEKHAWFGKYKGRINNYLAKAGYNMKQAEKDMMERQKAGATQ